MSLASSLNQWFEEQKKLFAQARKALSKSTEVVSDDVIQASIYLKTALKVDEPVTFEQLQEAVRERAYQKWQEAGCPEGDGQEFWVAAETDIFGPNALQQGGYNVYTKSGKDWVLSVVGPTS
jgi:hypothetical protein